MVGVAVVALPYTDSTPQRAPDQAVALVGLQTPVPVPVLPVPVVGNWKTPLHPNAAAPGSQPTLVVMFASPPTKT